MSKANAALVSTINATGGLIAYPDGTHAPIGDPEWIDLGDAYLLACEELGVVPQIEEWTTHDAP